MKQDIEQALTLLESPEGFAYWLGEHRDQQQDNSILFFIADYLKDRGIPDVQIWISTWPPMKVGDRTENIAIHWIVNLQQYFGQRLARNVTAQEVLDALPDNPTSYSLVKAPPHL